MRFARDFRTRNDFDFRHRRGRVGVKFGDVFQRSVVVEEPTGIAEGNPGKLLQDAIDRNVKPLLPVLRRAWTLTFLNIREAATEAVFEL